VYGLRPQPFYLGVGFAVVGLGLSAILVRETHGHARHRARNDSAREATPSQRQVFLRTSFSDRELSSVSQAGLVNNLNDGMAWGLFPLFFAAAGISLQQIGWLAAIYAGVWGAGQLVTGALSDRIVIAGGMWVQAAGIDAVALSSRFVGFAAGGVLLGAGTAMVYPTLLAAIGDVAHPTWRASSVGCTGSGEISATRWARCSLASPPTRSEWRPRSGSSPPSPSPRARWSRVGCTRRGGGPPPESRTSSGPSTP
jgi:hypothetical protein